MIFRHW